MSADTQPWDRREEESRAAYVERMRAMDTSGFTIHQQRAWGLRLQAAEHALDKEQKEAKRAALARRPTPTTPLIRQAARPAPTLTAGDALARVKQTIRSLTLEARQQLVLWIARGMPDEPETHA